ncbi:hypothetical protein [Candidatus Frankia nodulisporulans]|uniref:hypothetical protein n=1 Tax=Candidatus Frankia nodulisporulans TaxID=2060052 RepID=UPI0013D32F05|nr:hypothetical protein [Candidatus Frankia nodulisporulans]
MTAPQPDALGRELVARIFSPAERWGWEFAPAHPPVPHPEAHQPPSQFPVPPPDLRGLEFRRQYLARKVWKPAVGGLLTLSGLGALGESPGGGLFILIIGVALIVWYVLPLTALSRQKKEYLAAYEAELARRQHEFQGVYAAWQQRVHQHDEAERHRVATAMDFYPLDPLGPARVDVFGGTGAGWTSILATGGASLLGGGAGILLLDLSEQSVGAGLVMLANEAANAAAQASPVEVRELPAALERLGLLDGLEPREIAELLADAFDADRRGGGDRALRAIDVNILRVATSSIHAPVTFARLAAALRILDNQSTAIHEGVFDAYEIDALQQRLHDLGQREWTAEQIGFLRTELETLAGAEPATAAATSKAAEVDPAARWWPRGGLRVLGTTSAGRDSSARRKLLIDRVLVQTLLYRLRNDARGMDGDVGDVAVIAGADQLGQETLTALTQQAERAQVRLILLFKSLSNDAQALIGTGHSAAIFMRLGNAREAAAAAEHIGRGFRFVLSQVTNQVGTSFTEGFANSYGEQDGTSYTEGTGGSRGLGAGGHTSGDNWNQSTTTSHSASWTNTVNVSNTVNQNAGTTMQREKDFMVDPTTLQSLAATAFILVGTGGGPGRVRPGDCNPGLVLLPRVASTPRDFSAAPHSRDPGALTHGATTATQQIGAPQPTHQAPPQAYPGAYPYSQGGQGGQPSGHGGYPYQQPGQW